MKKIITRLALTVIAVFLTVYVVNSETDFFKSFSENNPQLAEKAPILSSAMEDIAGWFSKIPTLSQIKENLTKEEMPVEPETFAENAYIKDSPLLTFYRNESAGLTVNDDNTFTFFGVLSDVEKSNLVLRIITPGGDVIGEQNFATDTEFQFSKTIKIPDTEEDRLRLDVFVGEKRYGDYIGWINDYVFLTKNNNKWEIEKSPVWDNNRTLFEAPRSTSKALKPSQNVQSNNETIQSIAKQLTTHCKTDYERIKALHDWICAYLHYDNDSLAKSDIAPYTAIDVLSSRKAVCIGYANLYAALCRSLDIPCYVVTGYALGISSGKSEWTKKIVEGNEENHAWNEAYVDGRWVIIDSTWDTYNSFENGEMKKGSHISRLYFDSNIDFFSANHKIMNYE
ncbi:MAG: transglutaminase domain-containing protein [Clostridia bacterium]|nr:transglutaminase domain-containing protein [Clostridia bacterium]